MRLRIDRCLFVATLGLFCLFAAGRIGISQAPQNSTLSGRVLDASGAPVSEAKVRIEDGDHRVAEIRSGADGSFVFSGLADGTYTLTADQGESHGSALRVTVGGTGTPQPISIVLNARKTLPPSSAPAMEFADEPKFTVAGVTDWTAAGGHGSDVTLRASEALNRETLSLKPNEPARTSGGLAAGAGQDDEPGLRAALKNSPESFDANRRLGALYLREGKGREAAPLLEKALQLHPADTEDEYNLALACKNLGDLTQARAHVEHLLAVRGNADTYRLAGEIDEKDGEPLAAVREFEKAAQMDPSEQNYFAWGTELLIHRAVWQAKAVFEQGVKTYPRSSRLLTSLGAVLFAGALYDEAELRLCQASDLNPEDPEPYTFMGRIEIASPQPLACADTRLARNVQLHPEDALANYFDAMAIWKQHGPQLDPATRQAVESMLTKAVTLDPKCSDGYLQLGNLRASLQDFAGSIEFYEKALAANPESTEAHYRLGVAYDRTGDRVKAKEQFALHDTIGKKQAAEVERQRKEIKQFVVSAPNKQAVAPMP
ncbi:MAG: tetratricopeptide repeat protein [Terracidiphilus sp.]